MPPADLFDFYPWGVAWRVGRGAEVRRCEGHYAPPPRFIVRVVAERPGPELEPELRRVSVTMDEAVPTIDHWRDELLAQGWRLLSQSGAQVIPARDRRRPDHAS